MCLSSLDDKLEEAVQFRRRYLNSQLETTGRCGTSSIPPMNHRSSVLLLSELLVSLPFTNSKVEGMFSSLKVIKTDHHMSFQISALDDSISKGLLHQAF